VVTAVVEKEGAATVVATAVAATAAVATAAVAKAAAEGAAAAHSHSSPHSRTRSTPATRR